MVLLFGLGAGLPVAAQSLSTWDTSGNKLLNGTFYFREVAWVADANNCSVVCGGLDEAIAFFGNINFHGDGTYTITNSQYLDTSSGNTPASSGTYSISASGYGFISSPISPGDYVYGLVAQGIFIGSSTEAGFNDLFIAAPLPSPTPTNSFFAGTYSIMNVGIAPGTGDPTLTRDCLFQLNPDGNGNIGSVHASGYVAGVGSSAVTQNFSGVKYLFSNGAANVQLGGSLTTSNLIAGNQYLYFSPDGNFVFGGSPNDWNMIVGVKVGSGTPNFNGLYYQASAAQVNQFANGYADLNTEYGSFKAISGLLLDHQRILSVVTNSLYDYTDADSFKLNADGTYDNAFTGQHYIFGNGGAIRIGIGNDPVYGISVALQAPTFSGSGVFLDPTGILNSGSSALFTAGIVRGELISMYGSGLAATTLTDSTFPTMLGGVQVKINGRLAPILSVSPNEVQVIVPYETELFSVAGIQVFNNNVASNTVTLFTNATAPGIFTVPPGGVGYAAAQHATDFSLITPQSPAAIGETIVVYGTGLGDVTPAVGDGAPGPVPVANTTNTITAFIGGVQATVGFAGLSPGLVGLYQLNITVPTGVTAGDNYLDISGPDSYTSEALISIGGTITASTHPAKRGRPIRPAGTVMHKRRQVAVNERE
jgi:uncharacterized protein (TIGR03437 family)